MTRYNSAKEAYNRYGYRDLERDGPPAAAPLYSPLEIGLRFLVRYDWTACHFRVKSNLSSPLALPLDDKGFWGNK